MSDSRAASWDQSFDWKPCEQAERDLFQLQLAKRGSASQDDQMISIIESTVIERVQLPFYPESVAMIRAHDADWDAYRTINYLFYEDSGYFLNGTSPPIHQVNAMAGISVTQDNALDYLRFFCFFVHGEDGPFFVVESLEQSEVPNIEDEELRSRLAEAITPAQYICQTDQGHHEMAAIIWYSDDVFAAHFSVAPTGMVEMLADEPIEAGFGAKLLVQIA